MDDKDNDWYSVEQRDQRAHEYIMRTYKKRLIKRAALIGCVILTGIILVCITSRSPTAYQGGEEAITPLIIPTEEIPRIEGITKSAEVPVTRSVANVVADVTPTQVAEAVSVAAPEPTPTYVPRIDCDLSDEVQQMILDKCTKYDLDFALVMGLISVESSFRPSVISKSNDYGLMQINTCNHDWLAERLGITDFLDPEQNVEAGCYMLSDLLRRYEDETKALMCYNLGEGGARKKWNAGVDSTAYSRKVLENRDTFNEELLSKLEEYNGH